MPEPKLNGAVSPAKTVPGLAPALAAWCLCAALSGGGTAFGAAPPELNDPTEGQRLARELREVFPSEDTVVQATLRLSRPRAEPRRVPVESRVVLGSGTWSSIYKATLPEGKTETLTVRHLTNGPSQYEWQGGGQASRLDGASATNSFAGSDFALLDLGLEFFHWPTQILVTREMRKGRGCDVLESRPARTNLYSRVRSWIDQDSRAQGQPGLIMAEAYDPSGRLLKEFEIREMKEVAGQWQVQEMELRNRQSKTSTRLEFHFAEK